MPAPKGSSLKSDPYIQCRQEIEQRTANGETCEQIAEALRAQGVAITNKTVSRRRVRWGMRMRPHSKLTGRKMNPKRITKSAAKTAETDARKAEIAERTQRGESAAEIAAVLEGRGVELKKGASTILRLQTGWGLIPASKDPSRARKRKDTDSPRARRNSSLVPKVSKREQERKANKQQQTPGQHYPSNCSFGPQKRDNASHVQRGEWPSEFDGEGNDPVPVDDFSAPPAVIDQPSQASVNVAAEIMSVEFLVDLATSTLGAATNLKEMLLAYQSRRPMADSQSLLPPTLEDLSRARRKVREAAFVMGDLAADPVAENV